MTTAAQICAYLTKHGTTTRPELRRELCLNEKAVESAIRKLVHLEMVAGTGEQRKTSRNRCADMYAIGMVPFDQATFSNQAPRCMPKETLRDAQTDAFAALNLALFERPGRAQDAIG